MQPAGGERRRRSARRSSLQALYGVHPVLEALRARRRVLRRLRIRKGRRGAEVLEILEAARDAGVPVDEVEAEALSAGLPAGAAPQGVVLEAGPLPEVSLAELAGEGPEERRLVALDGVEDPQNVGAIARVAEACGVRGLLLTRRRAPPLGPSVSRASAGAVEWLQVARVPNLGRALQQLKAEGFWVFGCDPHHGEDLFALGERLRRGDQVVVLGAEGGGLRPGVQRALDHRVRIPMVGRVASLNVAAAAAVVLYELGSSHRRR